MSQHFSVRDAQPADLAALCELESQFPGDRLSARQFRHHLMSATARVRVLVVGQRLLGYSLLLHRQRSAIWRLYSLVIDRQARGQGLGSVLLQDAERCASAAGASVLRLEVRTDNRSAIDMYRRAGYSERGRKAAYYDDGVDALVLQRELIPGRHD